MTEEHLTPLTVACHVAGLTASASMRVLMLSSSDSCPMLLSKSNNCETFDFPWIGGFAFLPVS
jgi:hypothetical protein